MRAGEAFHLTYCSNIHPGERWPDVRDVLASALPRVREHLALDGAMAVGLRLSADAARELERPAALDEFRDFLQRGQYYVPTLNGFPYGAFHGQRVKDQVYLPDWRSAERLDYSNRLATILASLLHGTGLAEGSVSTVPGGFRGHIRSESDVQDMATGILRHAALLTRIRQETGISLGLALEPEPACLLETTHDAVTFFERHLLSAQAVKLANRHGDIALSVDDVRQHVGVCFDACHAAVEFEDPAEALARLRQAGVRVMKVQLSSALRLPEVNGATIAALERFAEDTYLHQVVERNEAGYVRFVDLPDALASARSAPAGGARAREWRVHFHVPIFLAEMEAFGTTQPQLEAVLRCLKADPVCSVLEVETYTWDVLPPEYRDGDVCAAIARELAWARQALAS
ncbi:MAG: metabolite traffic protein EboE [Vicinamibacterales bacterium]